MKFQFLSPRRINRLLALQNNVAKYYGKLAAITSEVDLKKIFVALQKHHLFVKDELEKELYPHQNIVQTTLKKGKSLMEKLWNEVMVAVLVNNRPKLIEYCRQNEIRLLHEIQIVLNDKKNTDCINQILVNYEQQIYNYLERLNQTPSKVIRKRRVA